MPAERLQKVLASAGVASRRASEALIAEGRVTVDGKVAKVGDQVDPERSIITVDGRVIGGAGVLAYLLLHKPMGVASTVRDAHVRDFDVTVLTDGCAAFSPPVHDTAIAALRPVCRLATVAEAMGEIRQG